MNIKINYNNEDITNSIDLQSCVLTDRYGGLLDSIKLVINDAESQWSGKVNKGDEITIKTDGYMTGSMYVAKYEHREGRLTIDAISLKQSKKVIKSKIWWNVSLYEILNDCARNAGLTLKMYGVVDYQYESLAQIRKTDLDFASMVCKREGYSIKVDDNSLIVFNEYYLESQETDLKITPNDVDENYYFVQSSNCANNVTVSYYDCKKGLIEQTVIDDSILGTSEIINEKVSTYDEAKRFAYGYLRSLNKKCVIGYLSMPYNPKLSAGSVFYAEGFGEFDDKYVVIEVSHNVKKEISSFTVRKVLDY